MESCFLDEFPEFARTLSLSAVARMSDEEAHATFQRIRWSDNGGKPCCSKCGCLDARKLSTRAIWNCARSVARNHHAGAERIRVIAMETLMPVNLPPGRD